MDLGELGRYRLIQRLGAGGMGEVFLARLEREEGFAKQVVLKRILPALSCDERFREMFAAEARIAASLNHPHVIQVMDYGRIGNNCYLAMEYIHGTDLATLLERVRSQHLRLPLNFVLGVAVAVLRALDYTHRSLPPVVHGDITPSNILVGREGEVKLADFGLARLSGGRPGFNPQQIRGKLGYMPPEIAFGHDAESRSDLFGVGAVLYELLTGSPPLPPLSQTELAIEQARKCMIPPIAELLPELHPAIAHVINCALSPAMADRFEDASDMEEALLRIIQTLGLDISPRAMGSYVDKVYASDPLGVAVEVPRTLVAVSARGAGQKKAVSRIWLIGGVSLLGFFLALAGLVFFIGPDGGEGVMVDKPQTPMPLDSQTSGFETAPSGPDAGLNRSADPDFLQAPHSDSQDAGSSREHKTDPSIRGQQERPLAAVVAPEKTKVLEKTRDVEKEKDGGVALPGDADPAAVSTGGVDAGDKTRTAALDPPEEPLPPTSRFFLRTNRKAWCMLDKQAETLCPVESKESLLGTHVLRIRDEEGLIVLVRIEQASNRDQLQLAFQSTPFAILTLDDKPRGLTPLGHIQVERGLHVVTLAIPDHRPLVVRLYLE